MIVIVVQNSLTNNWCQVFNHDDYTHSLSVGPGHRVEKCFLAKNVILCVSKIMRSTQIAHGKGHKKLLQLSWATSLLGITPHNGLLKF